MRRLLLAGLLLGVPVPQSLAVVIHPDYTDPRIQAPELFEFLLQGFDIKTSIQKDGVTYLILQKGLEAVWCKGEVPGFKESRCDWISWPRMPGDPENAHPPEK